MINTSNHKQQTINNNIKLIIDTTDIAQPQLATTLYWSLIQLTSNNERQQWIDLQYNLTTLNHNQQHRFIDNHNYQQQHQINHRYNEHRSNHNQQQTTTLYWSLIQLTLNNKRQHWIDITQPLSTTTNNIVSFIIITTNNK